MRTYLVLKDKARRWNENAEIKAILAEIAETNRENLVGEFSQESATKLSETSFDHQKIAAKGLQYEKLDQLTMDVLFGVE